MWKSGSFYNQHTIFILTVWVFWFLTSMNLEVWYFQECNRSKNCPQSSWKNPKRWRTQAETRANGCPKCLDLHTDQSSSWVWAIVNTNTQSREQTPDYVCAHLTHKVTCKTEFLLFPCRPEWSSPALSQHLFLTWPSRRTLYHLQKTFSSITRFLTLTLEVSHCWIPLWHCSPTTWQMDFIGQLFWRFSQGKSFGDIAQEVGNVIERWDVPISGYSQVWLQAIPPPSQRALFKGEITYQPLLLPTCCF